MPTTSPRMIITLKPDLMDSVKEFAASQGKRPASAVRDLLSDFKPVLDDASVFYRNAQDNTAIADRMIEGLKDKFESGKL